MSFFRNQRRNVDSFNQVQKSLYASVKQLLPRGKLVGTSKNVFYEQMVRRQKIKEVCLEFANDPGELQSLDVTYFRGRSPNFSQTIQRNSYLIAQIPPSILCYNHKVASSTWMSTFAKLLRDQAYFQNLMETSKIYK